jgi:hypothetical protein
MTSFVRVPRDAAIGMVQREAFLAKPCEFFQGFFGGRTPTVMEKLTWIEGAIQRMTSLEVWENNLYAVEIAHRPPFIHLNVTRHDRSPVKEWRHLQQIKNELVGPEYEAIELFPAESRLVDTANEYHLWVHADPGFRFPLGFDTRFVLDEPMQVNLGGNTVRW